jgi:hypothetical protein
MKTISNSVLLLPVVLSLGLGLGACKPPVTAAKTKDPAGTYTLLSIDGNKLPWTPPHEGGAPEVRSSTFTLNADGTFNSTMSYGMPSGVSSSRKFSGTYARTGDRLDFQWNGAGRTSAAYEGDSFTMTNEGVAFAYTR